MNTHSYVVAPHVTARVAALPLGRADVTAVDLEPDRSGYTARMVDYLRQLTADPLVREAIAVSSSSLAESLDRISNDPTVEPAKLERAVMAASRYLLRMCSRPTPFGMLAGVAIGEFGRHTKVRVGVDHTRSVRVDGGWLSELIDEWQRRPEVLTKLRVEANSLAIVRGQRLVLNHVPWEDNERAAAVQAASIRHLPIVATAMDRADRPIAYRDLVRALGESYPAAEATAVERVLITMIDKGFLLTELRPHPALDGLRHVMSLVPGTDISESLTGAQEAITAYQETCVGEGLTELESAFDVLRKLKPAARPPIQVELKYDLDFSLPPPVAREVEQVASLLSRLTSERPQHQYMQEYHTAFLERYGLEQTVPLLELLDPHAGLDAPAGYQMPATSRRLERTAAEELSRSRTSTLARLAWTAARERADVVLDPQSIDALTPDDRLAPPALVELCVQLLARSPRALDDGDFVMALAPVAAVPLPNSMSGRFARDLGIEQRLRDLLAEVDPGRASAQVFSYPTTARAGNVATVARLADQSLPVGMFTDPDDDTVLSLSDIVVGATPQHLYLASRHTGTVLRPVLMHMLNPSRELPNAARFLLDVEAQRDRGIQGWDWAGLDSFPSLPRVRYGRTILAPARWRADAALRTSREGWRQWCDRLATWQQRWEVPSRVEASMADQRIEFDLEIDLHRQLLRHTLRKYGDFPLSESLIADRSQLGWLDGRVAELVFTLTRQATNKSSREQITVAPLRSEEQHLPGGAWLYAKVYATEQSHDQLITQEISTLIDRLPGGLDCWYFVRYRDPDSHLRLRFKGKPEVLWTELLQQLNDWAGTARARSMIRNLVLDTYQPETQRYGGPQTAAAVHQFFEADSRAAIRQLSLLAAIRPKLPIEVLAAMNVVDILESLGDWDWPAWAVDTIERTSTRGIDRAHRLLIDPADSWARLRAVPGGEELVSAWGPRAQAADGYGKLLFSGITSQHRVSAAVASILHMHANRLIGIDRAAESRALALVRTCAQSLRVRGLR
ncbi:lantibiotic dehydratase [Streptomyces sp. SID13031]|uniref:lantibiotic dehydratase n=1 Tax=Streptomyces sp. SID13031 TaxID=2706046 RepID=UPI0013C7D8B1|nr:lantibiotic dehydratase [Streptomyces sp. SID13031]NEA34320.1 lantibiotic dehydratase [Streptomyces sp. SID13031]